MLTEFTSVISAKGLAHVEFVMLTGNGWPFTLHIATTSTVWMIHSDEVCPFLPLVAKPTIQFKLHYCMKSADYEVTSLTEIFLL